MAPRGLGSFIAMPLVGLIMGKFDPRKLLTLGMVVCAITLFQFSDLNLHAGYWDFFWPQLEMGLSLGFVFVPLTTITMALVPKETMGNATSLFNLVRNLGGSIGISAVNTLQLRRAQMDINVLGAHVNPYSASARQMLGGLQQMFMSRGGDAVSAAHQARERVFRMIEAQANMISLQHRFSDARWHVHVAGALQIPHAQTRVKGRSSSHALIKFMRSGLHRNWRAAPKLIIVL
jgi:DHA2 family multidrug resistance protein